MLIRLLFTVAILWSLAACSDSYNQDSFDQICLIYAEALALEAPPTEKWGFVVDAIKSNHPDFYQDNYVYIMDMDPGDRYDVYKRLEQELVGSGDWECPEMPLFFTELESS